MKYKVKIYYIWEFGQRVDSEGNPHQEDYLFPVPENISESDRCFILCDGMGGHDAGDLASSTVCEVMGNSIIQSQPDAEGDFSEEIFNKALSDAFHALDKKDTGAQKKMGTTMTFLKLHNKGAFIAHIGDSRVYHIRPGKTGETTKILFKTRDHSLVNDLIAIGELTKETAKTFKRKNVITRAMQPNMKRTPKADVYLTDDIRPGDIFYLCSDGMLENMEDSQICFHFSDESGIDEEKVKRLTLATQENRDNHTAIIVRIVSVEDPIVRKKPPLKAKPLPLMGEVKEEVLENAPKESIEDVPKKKEESEAKQVETEKKDAEEKITEKEKESVPNEDPETDTSFHSSTCQGQDNQEDKETIETHNRLEETCIQSPKIAPAHAKRTKSGKRLVSFLFILLVLLALLIFYMVKTGYWNKLIKFKDQHDVEKVEEEKNDSIQDGEKLSLFNPYY